MSLAIISLFGEYKIVYRGINVGEIKDFTTIKNGYLIGKSNNSLLKLFIPWQNYKIYLFHK